MSMGYLNHLGELHYRASSDAVIDDSLGAHLLGPSSSFLNMAIYQTSRHQVVASPRTVSSIVTEGTRTLVAAARPSM